MIESQFVLDILDLLLDDHEEANLVKQQLEYLSISEYKYTNGGGCFITFSHTECISRYRSKAERMFNGVKIESDELEIGADATLYLDENGIIDYLEIWSFDGNYPTTELKTYTLNQAWINSPQRVIKRG